MKVSNALAESQKRKGEIYNEKDEDYQSHDCSNCIISRRVITSGENSGDIMQFT